MATVIHTVLHCRVRSVVVAVVVVAVAPLLFLSLSHSYLSFSLLPLAPFHVLVLSRSTRKLILISPSRFLGSLFLPSFLPCSSLHLRALKVPLSSHPFSISLHVAHEPFTRLTSSCTTLLSPPPAVVSSIERHERRKKIHFVRYTYNRAIDFLASRAKKSGAT